VPKCYILVGVPGSGKSTWISTQPFDWNNTVVASTDNYVEKEAKKQNKTYSEVFKDVMPAAVHHMANTVVNAVKNNNDIVWDQTSTSVATRRKKLRMLPDNYEKIAVVFPTPSEAELKRRLGNRPGKTIPDQVMKQMIGNWEEPSEKEGFDKIIYV
jgi:predicted kinase